MTQNRLRSNDIPALPNALCVGQAFDIYGKYDTSSFMGSLFDPKAPSSPHTVNGQIYLVPDYIEAIDIAKDEEKKHSGTSREEFQQSIAATAKISTKYGAFSAQFHAGFSSVAHTSAEYMYAHTTYYDWIYQMQLRTAGELQPYLSASFLKAVEDLPNESTTPAQIGAFLSFFNTYGAYYTRQVAVGASLEFYVAVSTTSNLSAAAVRAAMEAHYKGLFVSGSVNADFQRTEIWKSYSQNSVIELRVSGGDDAARAQLNAIDEKTPSEQTVNAYNNWKLTKGKLPIVTYMQLAPISQLCGKKADVIAEAWGKIWPTLHPNMYIDTTSDDTSNSAPVVVLSNKSQPITPTNPKTSNMGCLVALLSRKTLETLDARYYCFDQQTWKITYPDVYNQIAQDLMQSNYYNQDSVLVFVTMGLIGLTARPTTNLYSLLLLAGAGKGLQAWNDAPETYVNYVLIGIPTIGAGKGAESYATTDRRPATMRTGAYFYKDFSALPYEIALNPNPLLAKSATHAQAEQASQHHGHRERRVAKRGSLATLVDVYIYCPDVRTFGDSTPQDRVEAMLAAIDEAGTRKCDLFLGPEFFFTHYSNQLGKQDPTKCIMYSPEETYFVTQQIAEKSKVYPNMVIVMGTCFEASIGPTPKYVFNNAYVYKDGKLVASCTKHDIAADSGYVEPCKAKQWQAKETGVGFELKGIRCYLQICSDATNPPPDEGYDLSIVPAFQPGLAAIANQNKFPVRILSNGEGRYYVYRSATKEVHKGEGPYFRVLLKFSEGDPFPTLVTTEARLP